MTQDLDFDLLAEMLRKRIGIKCKTFDPSTTLKSVFDVPVRFSLEHIIDHNMTLDEEYILEDICSVICRHACPETTYIDFTYKGKYLLVDENTYKPYIVLTFDIFYGKDNENN